ncbi:ferrochelatase [Thalassotalea aquiviva]|uniref:ferrochelatase n=1 Tax=Thalassotalea aquiviva TaxID=3242415 RepID=UPI00352A7C59
MSRYICNNKNLHDKNITQGPVNTGNVKTGVLLTNLGTPEAPNASALRVYLKQFLSDPRVVEIPRLIWLIILHGIILRVRPAKSAKLYQSIWTDQGSPLMVISKQQQQKVQQQLNTLYGDDVEVALAMRYGKPDIASALKSFQAKGVNKIVVLPLYPQYSGPTTGSTFDAITNEIKQWRWIPSLHFISGYHDSADYISALANSIAEQFEQHGQPEKLLMSFHGMPKLFLDNGDPYYCFCQKTARLVAEKLNLNSNQYVACFQSRFGKAEWLKPYTDDVLAQLAQDGVKNVAIVSPAFSADCLETLEELEHESREVFLSHGGKSYHYIPALNDRDDHINSIVNLLKPHI